MSKGEGNTDGIDLRRFCGQTVGNYRLESFLDEGAFGGVFTSTQMAFGEPLRKVAIKISKRPMDEVEAREMFADAMMMTRVLDGSIEFGVRQRFVSVYDAGRFSSDVEGLEHHPFVVMEYIEGGSLAGRIKNEGLFPLKRASNYLEQILEALAFMHSEHRVAHRDLKPENVLIVRRQTGEDYLLVSDFGLAIETGKLIGWVPSGGTLPYMAPESFSRGLSSIQSDVYALALIFQDMLVGSNPFADIAFQAGEEAKIQLSARQREPFTKLFGNPDMRRNPLLAGVIKKALCPDMGGRFKDAEEMLTAWRNANSDVGNSAPSMPAGKEVSNEFEKYCEMAEQALAVGDPSGHDEHLMSAANLIDQVPDSKTGRFFLLNTRQALRRADTEMAGVVASKGVQSSENYYSCLAMAEYYAALGSSVERVYRNRAEKFPR